MRTQRLPDVIRGIILSIGRYRVSKIDIILSEWRRGQTRKVDKHVHKQGHLDQYRK